MSRKTFTNISLDTESDKDILRWLERQENKSAAIRAVKGLERKLEAGAVVVAGGAQEDREEAWDEPDDAAAALNALAELGG